MFWLSLIFIAVLAYVLGSVNGAIIASKYIYKKDIRSYGSGNPGLTNFQRVFGGAGIAVVLLIDILKTVIPILIAGWIMGHFDMSLLGRLVSGLCSMLGHVYPVFYGFRGGKAVLAGGTAALFIDFRVALIVYGVFVIAVIITRYVSLGSICAGAAMPVVMLVFYPGKSVEITVSVLFGALLIYRHKQNIIRLVKGEESKLSFSRKK